MAELCSRLVRCVLNKSEFKSEFDIEGFHRSTYDRTICKSQYLTQFEQLDKPRHLGWLARGLLEERLSFRREPILVIALDRKREVETGYRSATP